MFDTVVLTEYGDRVCAVEILLGDNPDSAEFVHPDPPAVRRNWLRPPFGKKTGDEIVIKTGRRTARRIEVNLYRARSTSVAPPSVREVELYLVEEAGK